MENLNEQKLIDILNERFGEPIGKTHTGPGVADASKTPISSDLKEPKKFKRSKKRKNWILDGGLGNWPGEK